MKNKKKESLTEKTVKNSAYNFAGTVISKAGGLIFTIILARLLLPELFGIYSLVLSITTVFMIFTDLGMSKTLIRYASEALGKNKKPKAAAHIRYLFKLRFYLIIGIIFIIIFFGKVISINIFNKPEVYLPLLFACFYILGKASFELFKAIFASTKKFREIASIQFIFQISRILLVILAIYLISEENFVSGIFILILYFNSLLSPIFLILFLLIWIYILYYAYKLLKAKG